MQMKPQKEVLARPAPPLADLVHPFMDALVDRLGLSCVALGPGCREIDEDLNLKCRRIDEVDFFGVGPLIDSRRLSDVVAGLPECFSGRRLHVAAVNGPYRISYPQAPVLVFHLTLWPEKWLTRVCPFVVNGFREAQAFVGSKPGSLVPRRRPNPRELLNWHYGLGNCLRYIRRGAFEAPSWWIDGGPRDGRPIPHDLSDPYRMTEFVAYTLNAALCNLENFPAVLLPPSARQARTLAGEFRLRAVEARNGTPVDPGWLAERKPAAESLIDRLIRELEEVL